MISKKYQKNHIKEAKLALDVGKIFLVSEVSSHIVVLLGIDV